MQWFFFQALARTNPALTATVNAPQEISSEISSVGWLYLENDWPLEDRPAILRDKDTVSRMSIQDIESTLKIHLMKTKADKAKAAEKGTKDTPPPLVSFPAGQDNARDTLHPARWQRLPVSKPKDWWPTAITVREPIYKSLPWKFLGAQHCIAGKTVELAHDRTRALSMKYYLSENANVATRPKQEYKKINEAGQVANITDDWWEAVSSIAQVKEAVMNFGASMYFLWPADPTPLIVLRLMTKYNWASAAGDDAKVRVAIIKDYFNSALQQNADRAMNEELILSYEEHEDILKTREEYINFSSGEGQKVNENKPLSKKCRGI